MTNLVYMRIATHVVATVRHIILQARFAADWDWGLTKFEWTPGGGFKPGPSRSCSKVAIVAYKLENHVGRRIRQDKIKKAEIGGGQQRSWEKVLSSTEAE